MKILVTGTGGYIGSLAARRLLDNGMEVVGVDSCLRGFKQPMDLLQQEFGSDRFRYYEVDIRNEIDSVFGKEGDIDAVMHFAALCNVGESEKFPHQPPFSPMYSAKPGFPRPSRQKQIPSSCPDQLEKQFPRSNNSRSLILEYPSYGRGRIIKLFGKKA